MGRGAASPTKVREKPVYEVQNDKGLYANYVLGCVNLTWYDALGAAALTLPGRGGVQSTWFGFSAGLKDLVITQPTISGLCVGGSLPGEVWDKALALFNKSVKVASP